MVLQFVNRGWDSFYMCIRSFVDGLAKKRTRGFGDWIQNQKGQVFMLVLQFLVLESFSEF